ncbi:hypothetical protein RIF29_08480 [Crotalaria pallida]|uniref:Uncharacterized protein n=1 Tax=Crotalaria pallida TaxID=3830 RepID=A0AAN9FQV1_CROPI
MSFALAYLHGKTKRNVLSTLIGKCGIAIVKNAKPDPAYENERTRKNFSSEQDNQARLAQLVERKALNLVVVGSSPTGLKLALSGSNPL